MKNDKLKICKTENKVILPSEAAAARRVRDYDEIVRYYWCEHDGGHFHVTSKEAWIKPKKAKPIKMSSIKKRMEYLKKKINEKL